MDPTIAAAVDEAIAAGKRAPCNEQDTCFRIIEPLLLAMGYSRSEILVQGRDDANQRPDYTILPEETDRTWYCEAKAWNVPISLQHAHQGLNYANTCGKRWVVVTNGQEWHLYDNHVIGSPEAKQVCIARLHDDDFSTFLAVLSRKSVAQGLVEKYVQNRRLYQALSEGLADSDSTAVRALHNSLRKLPGLGGITRADIVDCFRSVSLPTDQTDGEEREGAPASGQLTDSWEPDIAAPSQCTLSLDSVTPQAVTSRRLESIALPDGRVLPAQNWKDLLVKAAEYALTAGKTPSLPFRPSPRSRCALLAETASPAHVQMREAVVLEAPYAYLAVETHFSAVGACRSALQLLRAFGVDPSLLRITVRPR